MRRVKDLSVDVQYEYDAVGNRRAVRAVYWDPTTLGTRRQDELWYAYDSANRFTITKGALSGARATSAADTAVRVVLGSEGIQLPARGASGRPRRNTISHSATRIRLCVRLTTALSL